METKKKTGIFSQIKQTLKTDDVFFDNEVESNRLVSSLCFNSAIMLLVVWVLMLLGIFPLNGETLGPVVWQGILELLVPIALSNYFKHEKWWLKYLLLFGLVVVYARIDSMMTYKVALLMAVPTVVSTRYFSKGLTIATASVSVICFAISAYIGATRGLIDLNIVSLPMGTSIPVMDTFLGVGVSSLNPDPGMLQHNTLFYAYLPKLLIFILIALISVSMANRGREMVLSQEEITKKTSRIESELSLARDIQAHMLPQIFPPFPGHTEFDIYALMDPAKEVGGDFYDFFMTDEDHLAVVMGDVSGKGVPAALFMVIAKTLIKNYAQNKMDVGEVFTKVNELLCEGNDTQVFVTAWLGILNLSTGHMNYVNAGHNPPVICRDGRATFINSRSGFVLAGLENVKYKKGELVLHKGDILYLYTDGVTEAENEKQELYGNSRLLSVISEKSGEPMGNLLRAIKSDVDRFEGKAEQFDDITMLGIRYQGGSNMKEKQFDATIQNIEKVTDFVNAELEKYDCPMKAMMQIDVAIDEIFSNISHYAYKPEVGPATVRVEVDENPLTVIITFIDHGVPYDPLSQEDPDVTLSAEEREIGGLGVFLVKKTMDYVNYEYKEGQNILTVKKNI
ncbi:MAG: SpoIIE family protein phosphatase [Erysipelotrichaceae bacterium]|nr:SpoIIE family protein phosphatase [Erysipelotrichaceae bacterium]